MGAIRLFLALVVAFDHFRVLILMPMHQDVSGSYELGMNAGYAVMYFYAISGFLISFVLDKKYSTAIAGTVEFYRNRVIRIFSLYLPVALLSFLIIPATKGIFLASSLGDKFTALGLFGMSWRVQFAAYPAEHAEAALFALPQAWTLDPELTFYALAPFLLRSWKGAVALFAVSAIIRAAFVVNFGFSNTWTYHFIPSTFLFFLMGSIAYRASFGLNVLNRPLVGIGLLLAALFSLNCPANAYWDTWRFWVAITLFALSLPGIFAASKTNGLLNFAGDLSFPVYLTHIIVLKLGDQWYRDARLSPEARCLLFMLCVIAVATLALLIIERPTALLMNLLSRRAYKPGAASLVISPSASVANHLR